MTAPPTGPAGMLYCAEAAVLPPAGRRITGLIVCWDVPGNASTGPSVFVAGSIELPSPLSKVKLLIDHNHADPVGYMESATSTAEGMVGTFVVSPGSRGDWALEQAAAKLRDGLSVGAQITDYGFDDADRLLVKASVLTETSLVSIPAFGDSLVTEVTAQRKDKFVTRSTLAIAASQAADPTPPAPQPAPEPAPQPAPQPATTPPPAPEPATPPAALSLIPLRRCRRPLTS